MLAKKQIVEAVNKLPDETTYEEIIDTVNRVAFLSKVDKGLQDIENGKVYTDAQVESIIASWS